MMVKTIFLRKSHQLKPHLVMKKLMDDGSIQEIFDKYGVLYVAPEA